MLKHCQVSFNQTKSQIVIDVVYPHLYPIHHMQMRMFRVPSLLTPRCNIQSTIDQAVLTLTARLRVKLRALPVNCRMPRNTLVDFHADYYFFFIADII